MTEDKPHLPRPRADDRKVVEEMLRDSKSGQWHECLLSVKRLVQVQAKNIPEDHWDDIAQDAMIRVHKSLPTFQYQCTFSTWLFGIVRSSIIDDYRKFVHAGQFRTPIGDLYDDSEYEANAFVTHMPDTIEDEYIIHDELIQALAALQEYVSTHANTIRNQRILNVVIFEGRSLEAAAKAVGCSAALAGYVVRSAQRYVREKWGHQP